jgi:hypothetical protein
MIYRTSSVGCGCGLLWILELFLRPGQGETAPAICAQDCAPGLWQHSGYGAKGLVLGFRAGRTGLNNASFPSSPVVEGEVMLDSGSTQLSSNQIESNLELDGGNV